MLALQQLRQPFDSLIFANRDELHLGRDDAAPRVMHLRHIRTATRTAWSTPQIEAQLGELGIVQPIDAEAR